MQAGQGRITSPVEPGYCLDIHDGSKANNVHVQLRPCHWYDNQQWTYSPSLQTPTAIINVNSGLCLTCEDGGPEPGFPVGTRVVQYTCDGASNALWTQGADGTLHPSHAPHMCLDITEASSTNGTKLQLWTCNTHTFALPSSELHEACNMVLSLRDKLVLA